MISRVLSAIRNLSTTNYSSSSKSLGRWNSVVTKVDLIDNKYIDWANLDNCYCGNTYKNVEPFTKKIELKKNKVTVKIHT